MKATTKKTLGYYWKFASRYKGQIFWTYLTHTIMIIAGFIILPLIAKYFIDTLIGFSGENKSDIYPDLLYFWGLIVVIDIVAFTVLGRISEFLFANVVMKIFTHLSDFCFEKLHIHSYSFFANEFVGSLVSKVQRFIYSFANIADIIQFDLFPQVLTFSISIGVIWYFAPLIGMIIAVWILLFMIVVVWVMRKWKIPYSIENAAQQSKTNGMLADTIANATTIKMFARNDLEIETYGRETEEWRRLGLRSWNAGNWLNVFQAAFMAILEITVFYVMIQLWMTDQITVGTIVLVQGYMLQMYMRLWGFGKIIRGFYDSITNAQEMTDILETMAEIQDPKNPEKCRISEGKIEFKNLSFAYEDTTHIFKNFSFSIPSGKKIGLVGESGAGKTTITKLLLRFSDPQSGKLMIDGQSISNITQDDLRRNISFVPQDPILFHRSLFDNIWYGNPKASKEEVYEAAKKAYAHDFILRTPKGYETMVGERGVKLSGGERQRVAIARALLKEAPILILDEATSALDSKSENLIQEALKKLMKGKTTIVIAHRLSTLKEMDEICVIEDGLILESGTHEVLLKKHNRYSELWEHQTSGFIQ